jgi:beta-glucosidase-like glycosyl hydrolase
MIMTGHLSSKALTGKKQFPCGMSKEIIEGLLRKKMGFRGVIISDAMNMKGIANDYAPEEAAIAYLQAGHDLLLYGDHIGPNIDEILQEMVPRAYFAVLEKVKKGELYIDDKVERILKLKEKKNLRRELFRSSITRVGPDYATPLGGTIRYKAYGEDRGFKEELTQYGHIGNEGVLVLAIFDKNAISVEEIHTLAKEEKMILALFDSPYLAMGFPQEAMWLIGYEKEQEVIEAMAEAIFGLLKPQGQIPIQFK